MTLVHSNGNVPSQIASTEELGRCVFSRSNFRPASPQPVRFRAFLERRGAAEISVDRLTYAPQQQAVEIADAMANARGLNFYGWAVLTASNASVNERRVVADPLSDGTNPFHANILLPDSAIDDPDEQKHHAQQLAAVSYWRERP